ncbi:hypothetical protein [Burkholderia gladioli]|nr:hypothetical protein [Burkholderia gladioli]
MRTRLLPADNARDRASFVTTHFVTICPHVGTRPVPAGGALP